MTFTSLLSKTVVIQSCVYPDDGQMILTYSTLYTDFRCRIEPLSAERDGSVFGKFPNASHKMFCHYDSAILESYRVIDGDITYEIRSIQNFFNDHLECVIEELKTE